MRALTLRRYEAGDHVAVHAANSDAVVEEVAGLLGVRLGQVVRLSVGDKAKQRGAACVRCE